MLLDEIHLRRDITKHPLHSMLNWRIMRLRPRSPFVVAIIRMDSEDDRDSFIVRLQQGRIFLTTGGRGQAIAPTVNVLMSIKRQPSG